MFCVWFAFLGYEMLLQDEISPKPNLVLAGKTRVKQTCTTARVVASYLVVAQQMVPLRIQKAQLAFTNL